MTGPGSVPAWRVRLAEPGETPRSVSIDRTVVVVGRDPSCDIVLRDPRVSRRHAELQLRSDGTLLVRDLGSSNGTYVGSQRLSGDAWIPAPTGCRAGQTMISADLAVPPGGRVTQHVLATLAPVVPAGAWSSGPPARPASGQQRWLLAGGFILLIAIAGAILLSRTLLGASTTASPSATASLAPASPLSTVGTIGSGPLASPGPASAGPTGSPLASAGPGAAFAISLSAGGTTVDETDSTTTPTCSRIAGAPGSLRIAFTRTGSGSGLQQFTADIPDTSAPTPTLSQLTIVDELDPSKAVTFVAGDVTSLAVRDSGSQAIVTIAATNKSRDMLTATVTCNRVSP